MKQRSERRKKEIKRMKKREKGLKKTDRKGGGGTDLLSVYD